MAAPYAGRPPPRGARPAAPGPGRASTWSGGLRRPSVRASGCGSESLPATGRSVCGSCGTRAQWAGRGQAAGGAFPKTRPAPSPPRPPQTLLRTRPAPKPSSQPGRPQALLRARPAPKPSPRPGPPPNLPQDQTRPQIRPGSESHPPQTGQPRSPPPSAVPATALARPSPLAALLSDVLTPGYPVTWSPHLGPHPPLAASSPGNPPILSPHQVPGPALSSVPWVLLYPRAPTRPPQIPLNTFPPSPAPTPTHSRAAPSPHPLPDPGRRAWLRPPGSPRQRPRGAVRTRAPDAQAAARLR